MTMTTSRAVVTISVPPLVLTHTHTYKAYEARAHGHNRKYGRKFIHFLNNNFLLCIVITNKVMPAWRYTFNFSFFLLFIFISSHIVPSSQPFLRSCVAPGWHCSTIACIRLDISLGRTKYTQHSTVESHRPT